jgi:hypothetical protein
VRHHHGLDDLSEVKGRQHAGHEAGSPDVVLRHRQLVLARSALPRRNLALPRSLFALGINRCPSLVQR